MTCPVCLHEEHLPSCNWVKMKGPFIRTFTKRFVNPLDLKPEDIDIQDIAHQLACCNRFVGALRHPVSVAQHSVCVSRLLSVEGPQAALYGLLHDASEAYLGDMSKWVKSHPEMWYYRDCEEAAQDVILEKFSLNPFDTEVLWGEKMERADRLMVRVEGQLGFDIEELLPGNARYGAVTDAEWDEVQRMCGPHLISELDWRTAQTLFLLEFKDITRIR